MIDCYEVHPPKGDPIVFSHSQIDQFTTYIELLVDDLEDGGEDSREENEMTLKAEAVIEGTIIQIATINDGSDTKASIWALTENGEIWYYVLRDGFWRKQELNTTPRR